MYMQSNLYDVMSWTLPYVFRFVSWCAVRKMIIAVSDEAEGDDYDKVSEKGM